MSSVLTVDRFEGIISGKQYDLHIHSCLSPCGDDLSTPASIAGIGKLNGLEVMALTDHNSSRNCPAFFEACEYYGITPFAGMELTTSEDIHVVCLFDCLENALLFNDFVDKNRILIKNKEHIFGRQLVMNCDDEVISVESNLLLPATDIPIDDVGKCVSKFNGIWYPAHIDRDANGIIATLGVYPENLDTSFAEIHNADKITEFSEKFSILKEKKFIISSDAHRLEDIICKC